jgi:phosphatidylglycerophosphatase A
MAHQATASQPTLAGMIAKPHQLIALSFGLGLSPKAPGTAGSVGGFALFGMLQVLPFIPRLVAYVLLVALASWASLHTGRDLGDDDHNSIVIDETLGMSLVLEVAPLTLAGMGVAFLLFRIFDIWKPWPIYLADQGGRGGFFVILDDLLAAAWAALVVTIAWRFGLL